MIRGKQPVIEEEIVQMYASIDIQNFFLLFSQAPHHPPVGHPSHMQECRRQVFSSSIPRIFNSASAAKQALDLILNSIVQSFSACTSSTEDRVEKYVQNHARLRQWESAFQPLLIRVEAAADIGLEAEVAPLVLSAYHRVGLIVLAGSTWQEEIMYDSLHKDFSSIVSSCRSVFGALTARSRPDVKNPNSSNSRFSFEVGILPPLYIVASKCRDPALRRQAIGLMRRCPVQEGLWEPFGASRICEWMMELEEMGLVMRKEEDGAKVWQGGFVPESSRVRLTGMLCELSKRRTWVQCKGVVPEAEDGLVKVWENFIRW